MKIRSVLVLCMLMFAPMFALPVPSVALDFKMDTGLANANASFWGENTGDYSGYSVAMAGDVNGDGYDDILIGAFGNSEKATAAGQVYLIFGKASGWSMDTDLSNADASFWGEQFDNDAGFSVAGAGDVNGDGYDDILIGAMMNSEGGSNAGQSYLILGKASGWAKDTSLSNSDASFWGEHASDYSGRMVAGAGDVNGDGYDDFLINAFYNDDGGTNAGQTYLILGKASGWARDTKLSNAAASFWGENADDEAGISIASAGDVNGDGYGDFIIGAIYNDDGGSNAGQTYLILGKASGWAMDTDLSNADASFLGEDIADQSGVSVDGAGDVNGDGYDDILIGALGDDDGGSGAGMTYIVLGKASGWAMDADLSNADASYQGEAASDLSGNWVAGAGDVNGDGYDDILIVAPHNGERGGAAGQTYLILGKPSGWKKGVGLSNVDASFWGENVGDGTWTCVDDNGDVNGDGHDDILIGSASNTDGGTNAGQTYLVFPDLNSKPSAITSVKAYMDSAYSLEISTAMVNDTVFIELKGTDGNSTTNDTALVKVTSSSSDTHGFILRLRETGKNTGTYRGNITIMNRTLEAKGWIKASYGETVKVSSVQTPAKFASIQVKRTAYLWPMTDNTTALEDSPYSGHYWTNAPSAQWVFKTNASWLAWNSTTHNVSGTPDNADVGSYYVTINVSKALWGSAERNFTVRVNNTPPDITTFDIIVAVEDQLYIVAYKSTDDGQGAITYHLKTDAGPWLSIDPGTGILGGTPANDAVGDHHVNVSVDDGNGGWDWSDFIVTVQNVNDPPVITTKDNNTAYEDIFYHVQYAANDIDLGDSLTWQMVTNASSWLTIDPGSGLVSGTPTNDEIGPYRVNITVKDKAQASDSHDFTLTVLNTNDVPVITSVPITNARVLDTYIYDVNATDIDVGDVLTYSLDTGPVNMTIVPSTGLIQWRPTKQQGGLDHVVVKVSDGHCSVTQAFDINVAVGLAPQVTLSSPENGAHVTSTSLVLSWSWEDKDSDVVRFDVYVDTALSNVEALKQMSEVASAITETSYSDSGLEKGSTYYWTVIPNDGSNTGKCKSGIWSFSVDTNAVENKAPVITSTPVTSAAVGKEYRYDVDAHDDDIGDVLTYSLTHWPDGMVIDAQTGLITWTPASTQEGEQSVTVAVSDGKVSTSQSFKMIVTKVLPPVNHKPVINSIPDGTVKVGEGFTYQVTATDADAGDVLAYKLQGQPNGMVILSNGLIAWTPSEDQVGEHIVIVNVTDGKDHSTIQFKVTVKKKETPPTHNGLGATMLGIIAAIVIAVILVLIAVIAMRKRREAPGIAKVGAKVEGPARPLKAAPTRQEERPRADLPEGKEVEPETKANVKEEIDLDDLEDED